jgi:hypothetical protein
VLTMGVNNRTTPTHYDDLWVLTGAMGTLPLVSENQAETTWPASTPEASATYYWRIVARDTHGATRGSPVWRFRSRSSGPVPAKRSSSPATATAIS